MQAELLDRLEKQAVQLQNQERREFGTSGLGAEAEGWTLEQLAEWWAAFLADWSHALNGRPRPSTVTEALRGRAGQ